jgi:hypothetical protein
VQPVAEQQRAEPPRESGRGPAAGRGHGLDRFTLGIAIGGVALVAVVFAVLLAQPKAAQPMDEARPAGVVHNYYLALLNDAPRRAYGYLSEEAQAKTPYDQFARQATTGRAERIRVDDERIEDDTARVTVHLSYPRYGGIFPFSSHENTITRTVVLRREGGEWKLAPTQQYGLW